MHGHTCAENRFWLFSSSRNFDPTKKACRHRTVEQPTDPSTPISRFILMSCEKEFNYFYSLPLTSKTNLFFVFFWLKDTGRNILETLKPYFMRRMRTTTLFTQWWTISSEFHDPSRVSFSERSMPKDLWGGSVTRGFRGNLRYWSMIFVQRRWTPSKKSASLFVDERKVCLKGWEEEEKKEITS